MINNSICGPVLPSDVLPFVLPGRAFFLASLILFLARRVSIGTAVGLTLGTPVSKEEVGTDTAPSNDMMLIAVAVLLGLRAGGVVRHYGAEADSSADWTCPP